MLLSELMIDFWMDTGVLRFPLPVHLKYSPCLKCDIATSINALCFLAVPFDGVDTENNDGSTDKGGVMEIAIIVAVALALLLPIAIIIIVACTFR